MELDMAIVVRALLTTKDLPQKGVRVYLHGAQQALGIKRVKMSNFKLAAFLSPLCAN